MQRNRTKGDPFTAQYSWPEMTDLAYLKEGSIRAYGQLIEGVNIPVGQMESITFREQVWSLIDRDHILHLKHDDNIKTLTHSLQKYKTDVDCNDTVWLVFVLISVVCDCVVEQLQYLSAVSVQSLWLWLTEVFVRLFITVWTQLYCWDSVHSDSNNLLYLQAGLHWWSEWNQFHDLLHFHWILMEFQYDGFWCSTLKV